MVVSPFQKHFLGHFLKKEMPKKQKIFTTIL